MNRNEALKRISERWFAYDFYSALRLLSSVDLNIGEELAVVPFDRTYFPASTIQGIEVKEQVEDQDAPQIKMWMFLNVLGLFGTSGCLPPYFNDVIYEEQIDIRRNQDRLDQYGMIPGERLRPFLGILNERIYHYLYQCWSAPRLLEPEGDDIEDFQNALLSLVGLADREEYRNLLLQCVTFFAHPSRSPWGLVLLLRKAFKADVKIEENVPRAIEMDPSSYSLVNRQWAEVGKTLVLGKITTVSAIFFRVIIGPLSLKQFSDLLPGGGDHKLLMDLVRMYTPMHLEYELDLVLDHQELKKLPWSLGRHPCRLGLGIVLNPASRGESITATLKPAVNAA